MAESSVPFSFPDPDVQQANLLRELRSTRNLATSLFPEAAAAWLKTREPFISPKTAHEYRLNIKTLSRFFGEMKLSEITGDQLRAYQRARMATCGPQAINHECGVMQQMLRRVGRWHEIAHDYQPLPLPKAMRGRALMDDEKERLFQVAAANPRWEAAYLFALISINTTVGPKEAMTLRMKDVDLEQRTITVQAGGAKNVNRMRRIPLNDVAFNAVSSAVARAKRLGSGAPDHYLFPHRANKGTRYDPTKRQTTFKTAWNEIRELANLKTFRMYDLRHHAITVLYENEDASEEVVEAIAGHVGRAMKKTYSHVRLNRMRLAVAGMFKPIPQEASLRNEDVLELLSLGMTAEIVAAKIKSSKGKFDTSMPTLKRLKEQNVPESVILAMVKAS